EGDADVGGPVEELALGSNHTCARLASGDVRCWGEHMPSRFAEGQKPSAVPLIALGERAKSIAAAGWEACALLVSGLVKCWGESTMAGVDFPPMRTFDPHEAIDRLVFADVGLLGTTPSGDVVRIEMRNGDLKKRPTLVFDGKVRAIDGRCVLFEDGRV